LRNWPLNGFAGGFLKTTTYLGSDMDLYGRCNEMAWTELLWQKKLIVAVLNGGLVGYFAP
jgi:hypothetical protein